MWAADLHTGKSRLKGGLYYHDHSVIPVDRHVCRFYRDGDLLYEAGL